jgi:glutamyl-tRNA reductase
MLQRMAEMDKVEAIISEEFDLLKAKYKRSRQKTPGCALLSGEIIKDHECKKAMNKLSAYHTLGPIEEQVLVDMSRSIVNKLLSQPTKVLKGAAEKGDTALLKSISDLFRLEEGL